MKSGRPLRLGALTLVAALALPLPFATARAQKPTPEQAQALLQSRPDLVAQLRQRIMTSGLTPSQIRARLRAEGYPENLLDAYLQGAGDSTSVEPTEDVYAAVVTLGIADSTDVRELRNSAGRRVRRGRADTTATDSLRARRVPRRVLTGDSLSSFDPRLDERLRNTSARPGRRSMADTLALREADTLSVFGIDIFASGTTQFDPNLNGPVDSNYRLGPGDRLVLVLTGDVEASYSLDITREGFVVIPQVGRLDVANLTMGQLEDVLYTRLGRVYSGVRRGGGSTRFSISPARLRSNQVYVIGDVAEPGSYRISAAGTVLTALYAAGGPTEVGSMRNVEIRRGGKIVDRLDVYDYLLKGDASHDPRLENGDVVFVPVHGPQVTVAGEVVRPAVYEVKPGENLIDAIRAAGGFRATANRRRAQIERIVPAGERGRPGRDRIVVDVDSDRLAEGEGTGIPLEDGDVIHVFAVTDRVRDRVRVVGNVWNPGQVGFTAGMKVSDALRMSGGVKPDVYVGEVLVSRLQGDSTRVQLRTSLRDSLGTVSNDMALADDDEIRVFSVTEFRPTRYVAINGAVRKPGRYPFRNGMTMRDLVLLAGGVEERAYLREAEIARLPEQRDNGRLATTIRVPLDSTYLFERSATGKYLGPPGIPVQQGTPPAPEVPLSAYDNVLVLEQPDWELQRNVIVTGEVRFPGVYSLKSKGERLSDVLQRAGGLTTEGYADGVFFARKRGSLGRIGIDLPKVLKDADFRDNLILQDGDSIDVPSLNNVVTVGGAVNSPVAVAYVPGQDIDFYIRAAGGGNTKADLKRAYVTQPNGKVESRKKRPFFPDGTPNPRAGSTVFVPNKEAGEKRDYGQLVIGLAQVMASLVAVTALIINSKK